MGYGVTVSAWDFDSQGYGSIPYTPANFCPHSLMVEHPLYTRHSPQIREQSWFESRWGYQIMPVITQPLKLVE